MKDVPTPPPSADADSIGTFPVEWCRTQFPALARRFDGQPAIFFDGPAGSQVPERVIEAIAVYLRTSNANHGGLFATSRESDALLETAHQALADLFGAADPTSIVFGANMTTLTFSLSRALARTWRAGDEIVVTRLEAYKLRPAPDSLPGKWMTGTQNHECIAGALAAVDYLAALGRRVVSHAAGRRQALSAAYAAIGDYERQLAARLLAGLSKLTGVQVFGIADPARLAERVPTFGIRHARLKPDTLAEWLATRGIFVWHGNFYALPWTEAPGLEPEGLVRIGLLHYNTIAEIDRLLAALSELEH